MKVRILFALSIIYFFFIFYYFYELMPLLFDWLKIPASIVIVIIGWIIFYSYYKEGKKLL